MINTGLNTISFVTTLIVAEGIIYLVLDSIFGKFAMLNLTLSIRQEIKVKNVLFLIVGFIILLLFFDFYKPW